MHARFDLLPGHLRDGAQALYLEMCQNPALADICHEALAEIIAAPEWRQLLSNYASGRTRRR